MNIEVSFVFKNLRYNIIKIGNDYFLVDKDKPLILIYLLPFLYWMLPKKVQQIDSEKAHLLGLKQTNVPKTSNYNSLIAGVSLLGANILGGIASYFDTLINPIIAASIILITTSIILWFRVSISKKNKSSLEKTISLKENENGNQNLKMWFIPKSVKSISFVVISTLLFWLFIFLCIVGFFENGNILILISYSLTFSVLLFLNGMNVPPGNNTLKVWMK
jgi:uncharacterized membrane protein (TIGR01218 family)